MAECDAPMTDHKVTKREDAKTVSEMVQRKKEYFRHGIVKKIEELIASKGQLGGIVQVPSSDRERCDYSEGLIVDEVAEVYRSAGWGVEVMAFNKTREESAHWTIILR
jgi:hypothetical protein